MLIIEAFGSGRRNRHGFRYSYYFLKSYLHAIDVADWMTDLFRWLRGILLLSIEWLLASKQEPCSTHYSLWLSIISRFLFVNRRQIFVEEPIRWRAGDSSARVVTKLRNGRQQIGVWYLTAVCSLSRCSDRLWGPTSLLSADILTTFTESKAVALWS